jgi:hypothetical protein
MLDPTAAARGTTAYTTSTSTTVTRPATASAVGDKDKVDTAVILGGLAGLNAALRARLDELMPSSNSAAPANGETVRTADGMDTRRLRDRYGREFEEKRLRDPKTGLTLFLTLTPTDGGEGRVTIMAGEKGNPNFTIALRKKDAQRVPGDLIAAALVDLARERGFDDTEKLKLTVRFDR